MKQKKIKITLNKNGWNFVLNFGLDGSRIMQFKKQNSTAHIQRNSLILFNLATVVSCCDVALYHTPIITAPVHIYDDGLDVNCDEITFIDQTHCWQQIVAFFFNAA